MASRSLGSLTLDMIARFGGFEAGMDRLARSTEQGFKRIERASKDANKQFQRFQDNLRRSIRRGVAAFVSVQTVRSIVSLNDEYKKLENRLGLVTGSTEELAKVQKSLFDIAQRTSADLTGVSSLYIKLAQSAKELGASQSDLLRFTEGIGNALRLEGATAQSASGALLQLSQILSGVVVRAEEYNSINEGAPEILRIVARNIEATGGSIGKLRQMVVAGTLSSKEFFEAFLAGVEDTNKRASAMASTIGQAFQRLRNVVLQAVGGADLSSLAQSIDEIASVLSDPAVQRGISALTSLIIKLVSAPLRTIGAIADGFDAIGAALSRLDTTDAQEQLEGLDRQGVLIQKTIDAIKKKMAEPEAQRGFIERMLYDAGDLEQALKEAEKALADLKNESVKVPEETFIALLERREELVKSIAKEEARAAREGSIARETTLAVIEEQRLALVELERQIDKTYSRGPQRRLGPRQAAASIDVDAVVDTKEIEKAQATINKLIDDLTQQNATFDASATSVLKYRLEFGDLSEALKAFGPAADQVEAKLLGLTSALDTKKARAELEKLVSDLKQQDATFGASAAEILRYRLTIGDLKDDVERAGPALAALAEDAIKFQESLEIKETTKQATESIQSQIDSLREQAATLNLSAEAAFEYSLAHGELARNLELTGDAAAGLETDLRAAQEAMQAAMAQQGATAFEESIFEATRTEAERYTAELGRLKEALEGNAEFQDTYNRAVSDAVIKYIDAEKYTEAYALRVEELNRLLADGTINQKGYQAAIENAQEVFAKAGEEAGKVFTEQAQRNTQDILANFLADPFSKGLDGLVQDFETAFRQIAANALAARIADNLFNGFDEWISKIGGLFSGSGLFEKIGGFFASLFGGSSGGGGGTGGKFAGLFAKGGFVPPGQFAIAGEAGPELILGGHVGKTVVPMVKAVSPRNPFSDTAIKYVSSEKNYESYSRKFTEINKALKPWQKAEAIEPKVFATKRDTGLDGLIQSFDKSFRQIAANAVGEKSTDRLLNGFDAWLAKLGSLISGAFSGFPEPIFAGFKAGGGFIPPGQFAVAGEAGPELILGGRMGKTVFPMAESSGVTNHFHFLIQAPQGTISRPTQMQIASEAARGVQQGLRRNG